MTFKKQFEKSFSYTWYLYLIAIIFPIIVFSLSFSFMHRAKENETLSIFIGADIKDEKIEDVILENFKSYNVRKTEVISENPDNNEYNFSKKLSVVAYNRCDLIIIPESVVEKTGIQTAALTLDDTIKNLSKITTEEIYKECGFELPKNDILTSYFSVKLDQKYYGFINAKSLNIGQYSRKSPNSDNTFKLVQYFLGK